MTIEKWLSDVYYDVFGTHIWNREDKDGGSQLVADIRGWGRLQNEFETEDEAAKFQDEVGKFIAEAIREKIQRTHKEKQKGILVELMEEDAKDGLYGSKESDEIEFYKKELEDERNRVASSQTEISDEEIENYVNNELKSEEGRILFKIGAKWYRKQLKSKI